MSKAATLWNPRYETFEDTEDAFNRSKSRALRTTPVIFCEGKNAVCVENCTSGEGCQGWSGKTK